MSGRGLLIIERLADRWGCFRAGIGKVVWLELTCRTGPPFRGCPQCSLNLRVALANACDGDDVTEHFGADLWRETADGIGR